MDLAPSRDTSAEAALLSLVFSLAYPIALVLTDGEGDEASDLAQEVVYECLVRLRTRRWRLDTTLGERVASMVWCHQRSELRHAESENARICQHVGERHGRITAWMDPARRLDDRELESAYRRAMSELPAICRAVFLLVREEEATYRAAAAHFEISLSYVCKLMRRAEIHLAARLGILRPEWHIPRSIQEPTHLRVRTPLPDQRTPLLERRTPLPERRTSLPERETPRPVPNTAKRRAETELR